MEEDPTQPNGPAGDDPTVTSGVSAGDDPTIPPSDPGDTSNPDAGPTTSRPIRRVLRIGLPVLAALLMVVMLAPGRPASWALSRAISRSVSGCVEVSGLDLDLGSWPVIPRAGLGRISNLSATADAVDLNGLRLSDVSFAVDSLDYSPLQWIGRDGPVTIKNGRTTAHITEADLNAYMSKGLPGLNIELTDDNLTLHVAIPLLGDISVPLSLALDRGGLLLSPNLEDTMPTIGRLLPGLRVDPPEGMEMTQLKVSDRSIEMAANFNIDGKLQPIACDAAGGVKLSTT